MLDLMTVGALASTPLVLGRRALHLAEQWLSTRSDIARERERRATLVAVLQSIPPGATLTECQPRGGFRLDSPQARKASEGEA